MQNIDLRESVMSKLKAKLGIATSKYKKLQKKDYPTRVFNYKDITIPPEATVEETRDTRLGRTFYRVSNFAGAKKFFADSLKKHVNSPWGNDDMTFFPDTSEGSQNFVLMKLENDTTLVFSYI